jgi:uncharacterized protein YeaO (DUF488 family)
VAVIHLARVYDRDAPGGGPRFLVERLWPRGVRRADLALSDWLGDVTLLYSSRDARHDSAVALREHLSRHLRDVAPR